MRRLDYPLLCGKSSAKESKIAVPEVPDIREDLRQAGWPDAEPLRQGGTVLVYCRGGDQDSAGSCVVGAAWNQQRKVSVELAALHSASDDEVMVAPGVIAAVAAAWRQRSAELRCRE